MRRTKPAYPATASVANAQPRIVAVQVPAIHTHLKGAGPLGPVLGLVDGNA
jgi:hypothetical protein